MLEGKPLDMASCSSALLAVSEMPAVAWTRGRSQEAQGVVPIRRERATRDVDLQRDTHRAEDASGTLAVSICQGAGGGAPAAQDRSIVGGRQLRARRQPLRTFRRQRPPQRTWMRLQFRSIDCKSPRKSWASCATERARCAAATSSSQREM